MGEGKTIGIKYELGSSAYLEHERALQTHYSSFIAWSVIIVVLGLWSYRYIIRPYFEKRKLRDWMGLQKEGKNFQVNEQIFNTLFHNIDASSISKAERNRLKIESDEFVYGEIEFPSFVAIMESINPNPYECFYDLGCGTGKAVSLLHYVMILTKLVASNYCLVYLILPIDKLKI